MAADFFITDSQQIEEEIMTQLTDQVEEVLFPGDERRIFAEALAYVIISLRNYLNDQAQQRFLQNARGEILDEHGIYRNVKRLEPTYARDTFRFTLSSSQSRNVIIPSGTRITPDGFIFFETEDIGIIPPGNSYVDILGVCQEPGEAYNGIEPNTITTLVDPIAFIGDVTNLYGTDGGDDGESYTEEGDDRYRERIQLSRDRESTAGTEDEYIAYTLSSDPRIIDASVDSPKPCEVVIYPLLDEGKLPDDYIMKKVDAVFNGVEKKTRIMTDKVTISKPTQVEYDIYFTYYVTAENEKAAVNLVETNGGIIDAYIKWQSEKLGRNITPDALLRELLANTDELGIVVERATILEPKFTKLAYNQVAKFSGNITVNHEVVYSR